MNAVPLSRNYTRTIIFDLGALLMTYLVPAMVHFTPIPVYMIEPMRLMIVLALVHTPVRNALLVAFTLPLFSFMVSGHPQLVKAVIIMIELMSNVALFYLISKMLNNRFVSMFLAILTSKLICYLLYWTIFSWAFVVGESGLLFLTAQGITTLLFSGYVFWGTRPATNPAARHSGPSNHPSPSG